MKNLNEKIARQQTRLAVEVLETVGRLVLAERRPADRELQAFFKNRHELGSRDRRFLSESLFSSFRWLGWTRPLGLSPAEGLALSWLLDHTELHTALSAAARPAWGPLGGRSLADQSAAVAAWFPHLPPPRPADLFFPEFAKSFDLPEASEVRLYESLQQRPPVWLRLRNPAFRQTLAEAGRAFREHPALPGALALEAGTALGPLGSTGQYEVQDLASQAVVQSADPAPGSDWWDACAGAFGKALHLADRLGPSGKVLATDVRAEALHEGKKRARTDGIANVRSQLHDVAHDAPFTKQFDGVLVDAPCSGWGTWSRNADARWRSDPRDPAQKRNLQLRMLRNATQCVRPGGRLVYAVCTFTREETTGVLTRFRADVPQFIADPFPHPLTGEPTDGSVQLWPWEGPCDGMFIARWRRIE